ncbi:MAG: putative membrane protein, partial [Paracoccaceae bacterium]
SLALNLLVLGLVTGAFLRFGGPDGMRPPPRTIGAMLFRELSREDRRALRDDAKSAHDKRPLRRRAQIQAVGAALRQSPFDAIVLADLLAGQEAQHTAFNAAVHQAWMKRVSGMSDAERLAYADRLEKALTHHPHSDRGHRSKPDD